MKEINGKTYPMWNGFIDNKTKWIGGILTETDFGETTSTRITDMTLEPNGEDSAYFSVIGEDFNCGFDVRYGGIHAEKTNVLGFATTFGSKFEIQHQSVED